ncbi:MAG: Smr/MutS family protein [Pseudomonadota bacterium]|nr:Smr/MutS family protein [Pseudomonadota bacterium]
MSDRTLGALDWDVLLAALARHARTTRGMARAAELGLAATAQEVRDRYAEVAEVRAAEEEGERIPVGGVVDVVDEVERAARGSILEPLDLRAILTSLLALKDLRGWADDHARASPRLAEMAKPIAVDPALLATLSGAFDATGQLSEARWPELGQMRRRIEQLRDRIRSTLDEIVRGDEWGDTLMDRYFTERDGRYVVPVKMGARRGLGIMHGTSQSGETAYVEPAVIVEMHNELRVTEGELQRLERRILSELTRAVAVRHETILGALDAATTIDLACARAGLGAELRGTIPFVGTAGVIVLRESRHPVLALKGEVVSNDLSLTSEHPGLVLTGPNAGGKTVALKTLGLAALLVRAAIPVPAEEGSRVDFFDPILADIGDSQSVSGGLSTFSAHVGALNVAIAGSRPGALVLLDEVAVGTDPAQGAALARAVLEAIVDAGARVAVTTHYPELKAVNDHRFLVAAAQYADGKPTYKLELGVPGPSYALAMARRLGLPEGILVRARELLDETARELADRLERLTEERAEVRRRAEGMEALERQLRERDRKLAEAEARIVRESEKRVAALTEKTATRLKKREEEVRTMVAALQAGADLKAAGTALADIRAALAEVRAPLAPPVAAPPPAAEIEIGDKVRVRSIGQVGRVLSAGDPVEVQVGAVRVRVPRHQIELLGAKAARSGPSGVTGKVLIGATDPREREERRRAEPPREDRRARDEDDDREDLSRMSIRRAPEGAGEVSTARMRTSANTVDLRGLRAEDALDIAERFLDKLAVQRMSPVFLLHGHGTGALKIAVRQWLPKCRYARAWRPADVDEGGDAYTVVELK